MPIPGLRAAIIDASAERDWDELRRFLHFLRHASLELDPTHLSTNLRALSRAVGSTDPAIRGLIAALSAPTPR